MMKFHFFIESEPVQKTRNWNKFLKVCAQKVAVVIERHRSGGSLAENPNEKEAKKE